MLLASVRTSVGFWDTGDLQTVAWIAGIPYPTGFPGYVLIGWAWTHALPVASVAARLNALSAVSLCAAAATITALALLLEVSPPLAVLAGWTFVFAREVWWRGTYADVHPLGFAVAFAALALAVRWVWRAETRALTAAIIVAGAAVAIDNTTVLLLLGGIVVVAARRPPLEPVVNALSIAGVLIVLTYAYLPLRSAYVTSHRLDPTLTLGVPPGRPFWDDHHPATRDGFRALVAGTEWGPSESLVRVATPHAIGATLDRFGPLLRADMPQGLLFVAAVGIGFLLAQSPLVGIGLLVAALLPALFGASYPVEADPGRYGFGLYAVAALGIALAADRTVRAFGRERPAVALTVVCGLLGLAVVHDVARGRAFFDTRGDTRASALGARVADATRDGAVVVAVWDWATPLAYKAYVERGLGRRIILCALPEDYLDEYAAWMRGHQVAIVSDGEPDLPGYRTRALSGGTPQVYEVLPP